jgi:hypothetical protein
MQTSPCPDDRLYLALSKNDGRPPLQTTGKTKLENDDQPSFPIIFPSFCGFSHGFPMGHGLFFHGFPSRSLGSWWFLLCLKVIGTIFAPLGLMVLESTWLRHGGRQGSTGFVKKM